MFHSSLLLARQCLIRPSPLIAQTFVKSRAPKFRAMPLVTIASNIKDALEKHQIIPDVLDNIANEGLITVSYGKDTEVTLGNTLKISDTQERPQINLTFTESKPDDSYTLIMTDPDAPTRGDKKWSEYCHYIVSSIKPQTSGGEVVHVDYASAKEIVPYMGPAPPAGTGKHRYVFVLFKETPGVTPGPLPGDNRANWGTGVPGSGAMNYAAQNKLSPIAVNFFYAQNVE